MSSVKMQSSTQGIIYALIAFSTWGLQPLFFKYLEFVPAGEIVSHRITWSCVFLTLLMWWMKAGKGLLTLFRQPKNLILLLLTACLIATNWLLYIWAITHNHMLESSLGYFINPLLNVLLGMLFLGERLYPWQWFATALACIGVLLQIVLLGNISWIALTLAGSFALYGLLRKQIKTDALTGLYFETLVLTPVSIGYLVFVCHSATSNLAANSWTVNALLIATGIVTTVPLLCFTAGAKRLKLSTIGFFQYISPSLLFIFAIVLYHEPISWAKASTFVLIWIGLAIFSVDSLRHSRAATKPGQQS